jgi:hypothetical protein
MLSIATKLRDPGLRSQVALAERLRKRSGLTLEVVALDDALRRRSLMVEILRDGRVLFDAVELASRQHTALGRLADQAPAEDEQ